MIYAAAICFALHAAVASVDGVYFHLIKYKLHTRPDSVTEHLTHTIRAGTMTAASFLFFVLNIGGLLLWAGLGLIALDLVVETWDVLIEKRSRETLGGLSPAEYLVHAHSILLYAAAYTLVLAAKPAGAFSASAPLLLAPNPEAVRWLGWISGGAGVIATVQHVWYLHPRYRRGSETA